MSLHHPYNGLTKVLLGNGQSLPVHHTGNGTVTTPHQILTLTNVLHVPKMATNLLFVQKLAANNNCSLTFDVDSVTIQDRLMNRPIFRGYTRNGLYSIPSMSNTPISHSTFFAFKDTAPV